MQDGSRLLGHVRYPCTNMQVQNICNAISHKVEKEGKPHRKNLPPKREINTIKENEREDIM